MEGYIYLLGSEQENPFPTYGDTHVHLNALEVGLFLVQKALK